ncbi:NAD-dependent epimerase/dehydratase family protein [Blastopirellula marina]|uniref:CDP-abequose synthase n=1 Tax=Blastopirellula marina DSM 3645 TaxID=314230 RepID=A3ZSY1_9BACT|nr:NAD-dependent epimerase/dehydratase family protein [Blastopirellula marina]EAQ80407.1 CDP-abequose synthase [Blastopirellula marina DSM 3645]
MRIAITGATGFVGRHLVRRLVERGESVRLIMRSESDAAVIGEALFHCEVFRHDGNTESLSNYFQQSRPEVVIHLASLVAAEHQPSDVRQLIESNVTLATQLVEAMCAAGTGKLINTGTSWQHYQNESYNPVNLYAATKQAFESIVRYYVEAHELQVIHLKLYDTYGPDDPRQKLIPLLNHCRQSRELLRLSPGEQWIDILHVDDVVDAYVAAIARFDVSALPEETFAVSSGAPVSLRNLVGQFEQIVGQKLNVDWGSRPYRNREVMRPWSSGTPIPGWRPKVKFHSGIANLLGTDLRAA